MISDAQLPVSGPTARVAPLKSEPKVGLAAAVHAQNFCMRLRFIAVSRAAIGFFA